MIRIDWLGRWALYFPGKVAVREFETGRSMTYGQFQNSANRLAHALTQRYGLRRGDRIAILSENRLEFFTLLFAAQKTGVILVPMNYRLAPREFDLLFRDAEPSLAIVEEKFLPQVESLPAFAAVRTRVTMEKFADEIYSQRDIPFDFQSDSTISEDDPALILYTSGTTGVPKGALYTHTMMFWNSVNTTMRLDIVSSDKTITCLPLFHTGGWNVLSTPFLHRGASFILLKKFDPDLALRLLGEESITLLMVVPTMLALMAQSPEFASADVRTVRYFIIGGEALPLNVIRLWHDKGVPIRQGYGLTEVGPNVTSLHQDDAVRKMGSIGVLNFYLDGRIVDEHEKDVAGSGVGELWLKGPSVSPGYWRNPDATAESLTDGWFHTGDLVRRDEEGYLYVVDRKKNMYISGGENVYPAEVEKFLLSHPGVAEVAIVGVPDSKWGESGKAFVVPKPGVRLTESELLEFCAGNLAKYKIPKRIEFLSSLPKNDTGKIDRKQLRTHSP